MELVVQVVLLEITMVQLVARHLLVLWFLPMAVALVLLLRGLVEVGLVLQLV
jgi:hypothetical protein